MAEVTRLWIKRAHRGPMDAVERVRLVAGRGVEGSADQGGKRQVTILSEEAWAAALADCGDPDLEPSVRRANLLVRGIDLAETRGRVLRLGAARVRIYGETAPCHWMDEVHLGLKDALRPHWRGGAFAEILDDADIALGDPVRWDDS